MGTKGTARASRTYFRAIRGREGTELWKRHRAAFFLHYIIALRARVAPGFNQHGLEPGQSLIGDCKELGLTQAEYRTAKKILESNGFVTFKTTSRGTIATLTRESIFTICPEPNDEQNSKRPTIDQQADDKRMTTNKNEENERKEEGNSTTLGVRSTPGLLAGAEKPPGRKFISELKMQLDIAEQQYQEFKERNGFHDAMGFKWTSEAARQRGRELTKRIADLRRQILEA